MSKKLLFLQVFFVISACGGEGERITTSDNILPAVTLISDIQGSGSVSPMVGEAVKFIAIVTGDFQDNDADTAANLGGFYVQQETTDRDNNTSDGIFIFDNKSSTDVKVGDLVEISGTVNEHYGETQIAASTIKVTGSGNIHAINIELPTAGIGTNSYGNNIADLEKYEGMLVHFPQKLTVSDLYYLEQYGEVVLSQGGRLLQFTNSSLPDSSGYAVHQESIAATTIILDDGLKTRYPSTVRYLNSATDANYSIRAGDSITGLTGNLRYSRGSGSRGAEGWRLLPTETVSFSNDNPRPTVPLTRGTLRVVSYNVLNLFSNIDIGQSICGPAAKQRCRGADNAAEFTRQLEKTVTALEMMDADIIGLMELENNESASMVLLVEALNARVGSNTYDYVDTGSINTDVIKTGFIYNATTIRTRGAFKLLTSVVDPRFIDNRNRPALAQSFQSIDSGGILTVVVNHLKSKGSSCDSNNDPNINDGQGNCNLTRTEAATAIADWIKTDPTASGDRDFLVIGDFNAYAMEDPLMAFTDNGLSNLLQDTSNQYTYVFKGQAGALDYALATADLVTQVTQALLWHINADEPAILDYNLENRRDAALFNAGLPYRASDHDPVIIDLDLVN